MRLHKALALTLHHYGMTDLFGVMGSGNMYVVSDVIDAGVNYIPAAREDGAVLMADGYARTTGKIGFVTVTYGPSLANTPNALVEAVRNHTPMLVFVGDTPTNVRSHLHDIDQRRLLDGTGVGFQDVKHPSMAVEDVEIAIRRCVIERRPIVVNVPLDYQIQEVSDPQWSQILPANQRFVPDADRVDAALGLLASAQRPLVVIGQGARSQDAQTAIGLLADKLGALVSTTVKAKGALRGHPFNVGICGQCSSVLAQEQIALADCIIAFGAGLNKYTRTAMPSVPVIQVDDAREQLGVIAPVEVEILGDAAATAQLMTEWLDASQHTPTDRFRTEELRQAIQTWDPRAQFVDHSSSAGVDMRSVCIELDEALPQDRLVVSDGGRFFTAPIQYLNVSDPASFVLPVSFGSIGLGLPAAIGAATANRDVTTLLVVGDGGWMMSSNELCVAVRERLDLIVVIMNDSAYGMEWHHLTEYGYDPAPSTFDWPSFSEMGRALGAHAADIHSIDDLRKALANRPDSLPLVLNVRVDPAARLGVLD